MSDLVGYARVSTRDQDYNGQQAELEAAGCTWVYREKESGARTDRPELRKAIAKIESGDVLVAAGSTACPQHPDLLNILAEIAAKGAGFKTSRQLGRHHHPARSADVDRARWSGRVRARPNSCPNWRGAGAG